ncbi:MAG: dsDNA nuclease domain-containing protein [Armatimonadota bacterium]
MASAIDLLASIPPDETGGPTAKNRLDYQSDWTFCLLIRLHLQGKNYVVVCDYHDDVVVLDQSIASPTLDFYQVKTDTTKSWTINRLVKRKKGKDGPLPSILGKLFGHRSKFGEAVRSVNFVSHPPLSGNSLPQSPEDRLFLFKASELSDGDRKQISSCLRQELDLTDDLELEDMLLFHKAGLDISRHDRDTIGELIEYLDKRDPALSYKPKPIYRTIASEISRRTRCEGVFDNPDDIQQLKSISRDDFENMVVMLLDTPYVSAYGARTTDRANALPITS